MSSYRTGNHWGRTIVRTGIEAPDEKGRRPDDELVGTMDDPALAARVAALLNMDERIAASSLGTPDAVAARESVPDDVAAGIVERSKRVTGRCDCGHDGLDAMFHLHPCPVAELRLAAGRLGYSLDGPFRQGDA